MAISEGVKVHTQGRVTHGRSAAVNGDVFYFQGGSTGCVMITEPMSPFLNYYEYQILARGAEASIGIGIGERNYPLNRMPGWNRDSIGYHGDDGKLYHESGGGRYFGPTCSDGDIMGCGVDFDSDVGYGYCEVFFTKNGQQVGEPVRMKQPVYGLYPIIGLHSRGEKVRYLGHWHRQRQSLLEPMIQDHSPSNVWLRSNGITFLDDGCTLEYCGNGGNTQDVSLAQAKYPLDRTNFYFELEILNTGSLGAIAIGIGKSTYPLHEHPGWSVGAVGYHADDGKLFVEQGMGKEFGPPCSEGDRMGCGIIFPTYGVEGVATENIEEEEKLKEESEDSYDSDYEVLPEVHDIDEEAIFRDLLQREGGFRLGRGGANIYGGYPRHFGGGRGLFGGPAFGLFGDRHIRLNAQNVALPPRNGQLNKDSLKSNCGSKCTVYFTKNGERLGDIEVCIPRGGFFPLIGLLSKGERVHVDLQPLTG